MFALKEISRFKKVGIGLGAILLIFVIGTIGFMLIDPNYSLLQAFYMTVITVTTVGFREIHHPSNTMMVFIAVLVITSFGTFAYTVSAISAYIIDGEFKQYFKDFRVKSEVSKLENHVVICGFGRNGSQAAAVMESHNQPFVIIENRPEVVEDLRENHPTKLLIVGDATHDETLENASISKAKALITTLPSDSHNLFVVLTARERNASLKIISRASEDNSDRKLKIAGANNVIMPDKIGGAHMASLVMKPDVIEFMDFLSAKGQVNINLEEITFEELPKHYQNKSINELGIRHHTGANIIGLKTASGEFVINPSPEIKVTSNIKIFALGTPDQIKKLKELFSV